MDWTQYQTFNMGNDIYYLIQNIDDNLCLAIKQSDTLTDDELAGSIVRLYAILVQLQ